MGYQLINGSNAVLCTDDNAVIPPENWRWDAYQAWLKSGNQPDPAPGPSLAAVQTTVISSLQSACQSAITGGFISSALGKTNYYGSLQTDQLNLQRMFATSQSGSTPSSYPIYCSPVPVQNPPLVQHTQAQMLQVLADLNAWITAQQEKYNELVQQVRAAKTVADVQAITWG